MSDFPLPFDGDAACASATPDAAPGSDRRDFLQRVLTSGALVAGAGLLTGCATTASAAGSMAAAPAPAPRSGAGTAGGAAPAAASPEWDMSWVQKLGRYKTAYDSPEILNGAGLHFAVASTAGYRATGAAASDITPVVILRHAASVMTLNDEMWARVGIGETRKVNDPRTGAPALRNPFINYQQGDQRSMIGANAGIDVLVQRGAIVLACNNALLGTVYALRQKEKELTQEQAYAEVRKAVLPGVYVMPNGIFAVAAAQDAGCNYMYVVA